MASIKMNDNATFVATCTVVESDKYTKDAYVRFDRHDIPEDIRGCNEFFLSPDELETLGNFLVDQAEKIRRQQAVRDAAERGLEIL